MEWIFPSVFRSGFTASLSAITSWPRKGPEERYTMNIETKPSVNETLGATPETPTHAKVPAAQQAPSYEELCAKVLVLESAGKIVKVEVSDEDFQSHLVALQNAAKEDLESANPKARPGLSLKLATGEVIAMSKEQKALWKPAKLAMIRAHSALHRTLVPQRKAILARVIRNGNATVSTVAKTRKDSTVSRVSISASEPAKNRKGSGMKKAKPQQIAGHVPAAGNAQTPAVVS